MAAPTTSSYKRSTRHTNLQRSQTRSKVNVVSKASLALLNPAHAMGIDASWQLEEDDDHYASGASSSSSSWRTNSETDLASDVMRSNSFEWSASPQSSYQSLPSSQTHYLHSTSSPTPELAAFTTSFEQDAESWSSGFGVTTAATSTGMQRTGSGVSSVFEDDEVAELNDDTFTSGRPSATHRTASSPTTGTHHNVTGSNNSGSKALSRLFTWKRSNNGGAKFGKGGPINGSNPKPRYAVPSSAPAHMTTFEQAGYALPPIAPLGALLASNSVPTTPQDAFTTSPLPSVRHHAVVASSPKVLLRSLSRKSSMPTLREVRKGSAASPLTIYSALQSPHAAANQIPRKSAHGQQQQDADSYSLYNGPPSLSNSLSSVASLASSTSTLTAPGMRNRISSVGKGVRKSSFDNVVPSSPKPIVLTPDPQEIAAQRSKVPRKKTKRFEPGAGAPTVPPLPVLSSLLPSAEQTSLMTISRATRRRSKSVDAIMQPCFSSLSPLPSLVTPDGLFDTSIEEEAAAYPPNDEHDGQTAAAQRVNLANRAVVVGVSSPKLVSFSPRLGQVALCSPRSPLSPAQCSLKSSRRRSTRNSGRGLGEAAASARLTAPVVVNVMPPTPDLSADEQAMFDGEVPSPGVRRSLELSDASYFAAAKEVREHFVEEETALDAIANSHATRTGTAASPEIAAAAASPSSPDKECGTATTTTAEVARRRIQSMMSEASDASSPSMHSDAHNSMAAYEPFSFARSLSMMSLSSDGSAASDEDGDDSGGEEIGSVQQAQIVTVSGAANAANTGPQKAQIVSPRAASLASPRCPRAAAATLLQSPQATRSRFDMHSPSSSSQTSSSVSSSISPSRKRDSARFGSMPSLSSGHSLASVLTTSTSILDFGSDMAHVARSFDKRDGIGSSLRAPAEIQSMLDSVSITAADEDDCETPRLSCGFSAPMASSTKPLNVRKAMAAAAAASAVESARSAAAAAAAASPVQTTMTSVQQHISPPPNNATMTPGLSPSLTRPYPRAQNSSSPHLELDLSLPLDLHGIGLGFEVDEDKPRRRGKHGGVEHGARPRLPTKSRARRSILADATAHDKQQHLDRPAVQHPKTPPTGQRLLASAMERDAALGLGLDLGLEGFHNETECFTAANRAATDTVPPQRRSSDMDDEFLCLSEEERRLLLGGLKAATNSSMTKRSMLRSSKALRSASAGDTSSLAYLQPHSSERPGTSDSDATIRPMESNADVGFAL